MREMIVAKNTEQRKKPLKNPSHARADFKALFEVMNGLCNYSPFGPAFNELLPTAEGDIKNLSIEMGIPFEDLKTQLPSFMR